MDLEKLTDRARGFLQAAQTIAAREHQQRITPAHLLKALLDDEQGMAAGLISAAGGDAKAAQAAVDALVAKIPSVTGSGATSAPGVDGDTMRVLDQAGEVAEQAVLVPPVEAHAIVVTGVEPVLLLGRLPVVERQNRALDEPSRLPHLLLHALGRPWPRHGPGQDHLPIPGRQPARNPGARDGLRRGAALGHGTVGRRRRALQWLAAGVAMVTLGAYLLAVFTGPVTRIIAF